MSPRASCRQPLRLPPVAAGLVLLVAACGRGPEQTARTAQPAILPLEFAPGAPASEFSGLCWWGDELLILPQFPTGAQGSGLLVVPRDSLARAIDDLRAGRPVRPLRPTQLRVELQGILDSIPDYDGLEAIAIRGDRVYALAEYGSRAQGGWGARLLGGRIDRAARVLRLDRLAARRLEGPQVRTNFTFESLILAGEEVRVLAELNGPGIVDRPQLLSFDPDLGFLGPRPMPPLEFRVTGASAPDDAGRFWVLNIFWPADLQIVRPLHQRDGVERLVPLLWDAQGVRVDPDLPLIELGREPAQPMRNWEGVARWGDEGFLLVADSHPADLLAYVAR